MSELRTTKELLHNVCIKCGQLYFWCPHTLTSKAVDTDRARAALARTLLAAEYEPSETFYSGTARDRGAIIEVFGDLDDVA